MAYPSCKDRYDPRGQVSFYILSGARTPWVTSFPAPGVCRVLCSCRAVRSTGQKSISGVAAELLSDNKASHLTLAMILLQNRGIIRLESCQSTQELLQATCCVCNLAASPAL